MMSNQLRQRIEVAIVRHLLQQASAHGFQPMQVFDGDRNNKVNTHDEVMHLVFNLDECTISFRKRDRDSSVNWVKLVLGNAEDCIVDYGNDADFKRMVEKLNKLVSNGVMTFSPCLEDVPAWTNDSARGVCIHCGCDRHTATPDLNGIEL